MRYRANRIVLSPSSDSDADLKTHVHTRVERDVRWYRDWCEDRFEKFDWLNYSGVL